MNSTRNPSLKIAQEASGSIVGEITSLTNLVSDAAIVARNTVGQGSSISEIAKIARVQPLTLISASLKTLPEIYNINQGILNIYASYYLQAVNILSTQLVDSKILKILDKVNPDRDITTAMTSHFSNENFDASAFTKYNLQNYDVEVADNYSKYVALEGLAFTDTLKVGDFSVARETTQQKIYDTLAKANETKITKDVASMAKPNVGGGRSTGAKVVDAFDKSEAVVGKVIEVSFRVPGHGNEPVDVRIPVVINLDIAYLDDEVMTEIITMNEDSIRFGKRFRDALSGRISFFKDFILARDLINRQKRIAMKDKTQAYATLLKRINDSKIYGALTRNVSLNTISGIMIISENEHSEIKARLGGDLDNKYTRQKVFDNSSVMVMAVVDRDWKTVSIYVRGIDGHSEIPFSHFKKSGNDQGSDILTELFKSITAGRAPTF